MANNKKQAKRSRKPRSTKTTKLSKPMKKAILSLLHKNAETKQAFGTLANVSFNSGIDSNADVIQVLPSIGKGTSDNQRIGDQIRGMSFTLKGFMSIGALQTQFATALAPIGLNSRIAVRMMIVQPKDFGAFDDIKSNATSWLTRLLRKGGTTTSFSGAIPDLFAPLNSDAVTKYYDKVSYITTPNNVLTASGTGTSISIDLQKTTKFFSIKLRMRNKLIKYDGDIGSGLTPVNYNPVVLIGYVNLTSGNPDVINTLVQCSYDSVFKYEDQ